jgi:hypothetical protein
MISVAAETNCFNSTHLFWVDIGYYREHRSADYYAQPIPSPLLLQQMHTGYMLYIAVNRPLLDYIAANWVYHDATSQPSLKKVNRGLGQIGECPIDTVTAGFFGGDHEAVAQWNKHYYAAVNKYIEAGWFAGKEQMVFTTVCIEQSGLCQIFDSHGQWFAGQQLLAGVVSLNDNYYFL